MKTHTTHSYVRSSSGYTLIELMVAMVIGLFLLAGGFQITQANKRNSDLQKTMQQVQKDGRFAINHLSYAIKTAGYSGFYGTLTSNVENMLNSPTDDKWKISQPVVGFDNVTTSETVAGITDFVADTDVLLLKGMSTNTVAVVSNADSSTLVIDSVSGYVAGDIVVVSDVDQASLFQVDTVTTGTNTLNLVDSGTTPGNDALLINDFDSSAVIGKYNVQLFYIKNGRNGLPALFQSNIVNTSGVVGLQENELVSNIKDMQISYGVDTNNDQILDVYEDAPDVADWSKVVSINLVLLASSSKEYVVPEETSFSFDTSLVSFVRDATASDDADRRLKRVFRTYVPLRNR